MLNFDCIIISGASGAVGTFLIREFCLNWSQRIVCILRESSSFDRLVKSVGLELGARCVPIFADLTSEDEMLAATSRIGHVQRCLAVHCAADVSWTKAERLIVPINVDGTRRFAELAVSVSREKPLLVFLSTAFISPNMSANNAYEKTKLVAERLLLERFGDLIYLGIVRCSLIVGSQIDGWISRFNGVYPLIKIIALAEMPCLIADKSYKLDMVPVNFVFSKILACVQQLSDKTPLVQMIVATGERSLVISKFLTETIDRANVFRLSHGLASLPPISVISNRQYSFLMRASKSWNLERRFEKVERISRLMRGYVIRGQHSTEIQPTTDGDLAPSPDTYIHQVIDYWLRSNEQRVLANRQPKWLISEEGLTT